MFLMCIIQLCFDLDKLMLLYKSMCKLFNKAIYNFLKGKILVNNELKGTSLAQTNIFQKAKYVNVALETVDQTEIYAWLVTPPDINEKTRIILVLHGNNDNRETFCKNDRIENIVIDHNFAFLVADYRDFGDSQGEFSKDTVKYDIGACLEFLHVGLEMDAVDTVAISLGTCLFFEYIDSYKPDDDKRDFCLLNTPICSDVIHSRGTIEKLKSLMTSGSTIKYKAEGKSFARIQRIALVSPLKSILETIKHIVKLHYAPNFAWKIFDDCFLAPFAFDNTSKVDYVTRENIIVIVGEHDELVPFEQIVELMKKNSDSIIMLDEEDHASTICSDKTWTEIDGFFC